ncbi:MAG: energy-coupling factor ABC transporter permease [Acidaminococcaceae bacterium]
MHMADALISPTVGLAIMAITAGLAAYSIKKIQTDMDEKKIPLMGVLGAFVFAAQMINFTIPATGSSGHIGGGMLLSALLGPYAGFLAMAAILLIQALFFGDGGLLAYGCNVFNMGFYTCFVAYPYIYKLITRKGFNERNIFMASLISAVIGLQLGAFSVVLETLFSGKTELPFNTFIMLMQPIHLAIGIVEGLVTASIINYVWKVCPELLEKAAAGEAVGALYLNRILKGFLVSAVIVGSAISWFASVNPDGLEWSMEKVAGTTELSTSDEMHKIFSAIQEKTAFLPDYNFKATEETAANESESTWPSVNIGTSVSGLIGGAMTFALAGLIGLIINLIKRREDVSASK